jgi:hypothetical protein
MLVVAGQVLQAVRLGFKELSARLESIEDTLRSTLSDTVAGEKTTSNPIKAASAIAQPIHHPDFHDESLRHGIGEFGAGIVHHEQAAKMQDTPPISQHLLRRLKRGYLLQYERDEDEREEARNNVRQTSFLELLKREECTFVHLFIGLFVTDSLAIVAPVLVVHRSGVWHLRGRRQERHRGIENHTSLLALLRRSENRSQACVPDPLLSLLSCLLSTPFTLAIAYLLF